MKNKEKLIKRLSTLRQNKNLSQEELEKLVDTQIDKKELANSFSGLLKDEIKKATDLYYEYIEENSFESLAEKSTLINLVYLEILKNRIQEFIKTESETKQGAIPLAMTEKLMELDTQIISLKEKLGMLKEKNNDSAIGLFNELKEKALKYYEENAGETYVKCPECQSLFRLLMKIDNLAPAKATFFQGTTLYNIKLMQLYHEKRITLEEMAEIFGVHTKYIEFIYYNLYLKRSE